MTKSKPNRKQPIKCKTERRIQGFIPIPLENQDQITDNSSSAIKMNPLEFPTDPDTASTCWKQGSLFKDRYAVMTAVRTCNPVRQILPRDRALQPSSSRHAGATDNLTLNKTGLEGGIQLSSQRCEHEDICCRCRDAGNHYKHSVLQKRHARYTSRLSSWVRFARVPAVTHRSVTCPCHPSPRPHAKI